MFSRTSGISRTPARRSTRTRSVPSFRLIFWRMRCRETCHKCHGCSPRSLTPIIPSALTLRGEHPLRDYQRFDCEFTLWAKTVLFATYDENGGFFDHVAPVTAPPGTPGEYVTAPAVPDPTVVGNPPVLGPIGLGFRVPMLVISPFSRGGLYRRLSSTTPQCCGSSRHVLALKCPT